MAKKYPSLVLPENPTDDSIDRVREILFGGQVRKFERHLEQIEKRLKKESDQLKDSTAQQLNSLMIDIKKEIDGLSSRLVKERIEWQTTAKQTTQAVDALRQEVREQNTRLNKDILGGYREVHTRLEEVNEHLNQSQDELGQLLQATVDQLAQQKLDRNEFADLLVDMSQRLKQK